jgi:hypothetical protein
LKEIVVESGNIAESLFERVDTGYKELEVNSEGEFFRGWWRTATKIPIMYFFSGNCAASVPTSICMCL